MKRRSFFRQGAVATMGAGLILPGCVNLEESKEKQSVDAGKKAKNIIFLVSDGMSTGTLTMADHMLQRMKGKGSVWVDLIKQGRVKRSLMDTASSDSLVTDSAAAGAAWGGGVRIPNGMLNMSADGEKYKPILQKFKEKGKAVGCVTTVPITHATPASFCINHHTRKEQDVIAEKYLPLKFDVLMGGGDKYFNGEKRKDATDIYDKFSNSGYKVFRSKPQMQAGSSSDAPVLGVFDENALPYSVDHNTDKEKKNNIPSLAEMTQFAIDKMKRNPNGFVMQVEGGKVDWAAHGNDVGGLIFDQIAFDDAVKVALDFAEKDKETLVIITTDHGNANPGLYYGSKANDNFDNIQNFKHSNEWILVQNDAPANAAQLIERIEFAHGYAIGKDAASELVKHIQSLSKEDQKDPYKLPFEKLAMVQREHTSVHFGGLHHTSDFVEVSALGPGSELLNPFVLNTELHNLMLEACGVGQKVKIS
ncbi:MAG: alkaline phosphatase [Chitinophagales bacterium]